MSERLGLQKALPIGEELPEMTTYDGRTRQAVNLLKTIHFDYPEWTPCRVELPPATWIKYREELESLVLRHSAIFPGYEQGSRDYDKVESPLQEPGERTDSWGVTWRNTHRGLDGVPVRHPITDWSILAKYRAPDPVKDDLFGTRDWEAVERAYREAKQRGDVAVARELPHGLVFLQLIYLRGFENLMGDLIRPVPQFRKLLRMVEDYATAVLAECLQRGADYVWLGDDFGMHDRLMVSPTMWRRFLSPTYERILSYCNDAAVPVELHSDGRILAILPDLIRLGVDVIQLQYAANGLEGLKRCAKGKVTLAVDLDRQLLPTASSTVIEEHIREIHHGLWLEEGGLILHTECGPDVPLAAIDAVCTGLERVCGLC
jgi:hypothetical protein